MVFTPESRLLNLDGASVSSPTLLSGVPGQFHDFLEDRPGDPPEHPGYAPKSLMNLRTRLNLVLTGLTAVFVLVLVLDALRATRSSVREEIEAANRVAAHLLGRLALSYADAGGTPAVQRLLGAARPRALQLITLARRWHGAVPASQLPGRLQGRARAPAWFVQPAESAPPRGSCSRCPTGRTCADRCRTLARHPRMPGRPHASLVALATVLLVAVSALASGWWSVRSRPSAVIVQGLSASSMANLATACPRYAGSEARAIGAAFNRMAQSVQDKLAAERDAHEARARLEERRELGLLIEQHVEEERRQIGARAAR